MLLLETAKTYYMQGGKVCIDEDRRSQLDYSIDLEKPLRKIGDTLASVTLELDPLLTQINVSHDDYRMTAWVKFATPPVRGRTYPITYVYTTNSTPPRVDAFTIHIKAT